MLWSVLNALPVVCRNLKELNFDDYSVSYADLDLSPIYKLKQLFS